MAKTQTRIHFDNAPYSISSVGKRSDFNLDLFQSFSNLKATSVDETIDAVEHATEVLEKLTQVT